VPHPADDYVQQQHTKRDSSAERKKYNAHPADADADGDALKEYTCQKARD